MASSGWVCTNMCGATNWPCGQNCPHFRPAFNGPDLTRACQGIKPGMRVTHREHPEWYGVVAGPLAPADLSALRKAYLRGEGPTLEDVKRAEEMVTFGGLRSTHCADCGAQILVKADDAVDLCDGCVTRRIHHDTNRQPLPPLTPTPADVDAGRCRWTEHGWEWTDYRAARGILPWQPGDELPEDAIRRLRDADGSGDE